MNNILYFYNKSQYNIFRDLLAEQNKIIHSITTYVKNDVPADFDVEEYLIDISSLVNVNNLQYFFEEVFAKFPPDTIFIADDEDKDNLFYTLRHSFKQEKNINELIGKDVGIIEKSDDKKNIEKKLITNLSKDTITEFITNFNNRLLGHKGFKNDFDDLIRNFVIFNKLGEHNILSFFLMGDSGVGKTEVARVIHDSLGSSKKLAKINLGNYSSHDALNSLIGSPRGYIGSEGGELIQRVKESDLGLVLIDEFEKSTTSVFNFFLDVLENGKFISSQGEEIDVNGYIFIFTSNISVENFEKSISPELRSRFDYKGIFKPLLYDDKMQFVKNRLDDIICKYNKVHPLLLPVDLNSVLLKKINLDEYSNMRELNRMIKKLFVNYISNLEKLV